VADTCEYGNEVSGSINAGNFLNSCQQVSFSRRTLLHGVSIVPEHHKNCQLGRSVPKSKFESHTPGTQINITTTSVKLLRCMLS
jgi:hypothetical protein